MEESDFQAVAWGCVDQPSTQGTSFQRLIASFLGLGPDGIQAFEVEVIVASPVTAIGVFPCKQLKLVKFDFCSFDRAKVATEFGCQSALRRKAFARLAVHLGYKEGTEACGERCDSGACQESLDGLPTPFGYFSALIALRSNWRAHDTPANPPSLPETVRHFLRYRPFALSSTV
jgi:hypothetical protein